MEAPLYADYFNIKVSDTGVGMDKATKAKIFDPFFSTKSRETGTGLGLSMVRGIIKNHNGFIVVYSKPGKGSVFNISYTFLLFFSFGSGIYCSFDDTK